MKTFTMLDTCDREGLGRIKRRDGALTRFDRKAECRVTALPDFTKRRKSIFPKTIPAAQVRLVDKLIRGE